MPASCLILDYLKKIFLFNKTFERKMEMFLWISYLTVDNPTYINDYSKKYKSHQIFI